MQLNLACRSGWLRLGLSACLLALAACTTAPATQAPARLGLKLAPASLGADISLQQHLTVERHGRVDQLDAALEVDRQQFSMVGLVLGQRVLSMNYDGKTLQSWRHPMLPSQVRVEDVMEDTQLTLWPLAAIREALPPGWQIEQQGLRRTLSLQGEPVMVIDYSAPTPWDGKVELNNLRYHYHLTIESVSDAAAPAASLPTATP
ncbi:DUF3261 domain-containing protein [Collimonas sp. OK412]|jgi:hypothetical protein|uniref:DUF3261 domain-containing protein n=1 Tax=Collimonas sp. (strain OK412) TaxID=1801619 RepID=UPI0008E45759|nr:DUF3261 domain-containing protein [Collimonas sp. OK412]SFB74493.1 Protein of unknown function [Collimonas sp. OK412]